MKTVMAVTIFLLSTALCLAQDKLAKRYGVEADVDNYPQASPKETLTSLLRAIENKRINYLLAQLADPDFVDKEVRDTHGGKFEAMVQEVSGKLVNDPSAAKRLRRYLKDGDWEMDEASASARI